MGLSLDQPAPEFSILELVSKVKKECVLEGLSPLHKFDLDLEHQSVPGIWRPSGLRRCLRKQVYKATRCPKTNVPYDAVRQDNFDRGHLFGAWFAAYVAACEGRHDVTSVVREQVVTDQATKVGGKADVVLVKGGHRYVVEVKSKENASAMHNIKPTDTDIAQLNDYMKMSDAQAGWVVYFGPGYVDPGSKRPKTKMVAKEFFFRYSNSLWEETEKKVQILSWFYRDRSKLAPKTMNTFFECSSCEWKSICDREVSPSKHLEVTSSGEE